uniref:Uncharacterized protein n=1 Tax=Trichuris muris TaxID=70415 RepID=A0A5S6Q4I2_TRIMR
MKTERMILCTITKSEWSQHSTEPGHDPVQVTSSFQHHESQEASEEKFEASWFIRFEERSQLHKIRVKGEAASTDTGAVAAYPSELGNIIEEGGYTSQQIFNIGETGLY